MERVVFVEILNRIGRVRERVRIDSFPATIGRAYTNSIIIDDKYVCPVHIRIALDDQGRLHAEDLGSKNGLYQVSPLKRRQRIEIAPDAAVRIGHTVLRFRGQDHAVPPAQAESSRRSNLPGLIENSYVSLGIFVLCLSAILFDVYLESSDSFTPANILGYVFFLLLAFAVWSGIWSFVNRLVAHRFRFLLHLSLAGSVIVLFLVVTTAFEYYSFLSSSEAFSNTIKLVSAACVFFLLLLGHLSIISTITFVKRITASVLVTAGIFGAIGFLTYLERTEFSNDITFPSHLKPVATKWLAPVPAEDFFSELQMVKPDIDRELKND